MTRKFLDTVRAEVQTLLPDNNAGEITPELIRGILGDVIDSCVQDEAAIVLFFPQIAPAAVSDAAFATVPIVYQVTQGGDATFLRVTSGLGGNIQLATEAGFTYAIRATVSFEGTEDARYGLGIMVNGVITFTGAISYDTGQGVGDPTNMNISGVINAATTDAVIELGMIRDAGSDPTIVVQSASLGVVIVPTNNP